MDDILGRERHDPVTSVTFAVALAALSAIIRLWAGHSARLYGEMFMTTTVVSTSNTVAGDALDIAGSNNVLILDGVSLISAGGIGVKFAGTVTGGTTTMNGFVYGDTVGIEMLAGGSNEKLVVNGDVQSGGTGIDLAAGGAHLYVSEGATISGATAGINVTGGSVGIENHGSIASDNYNAGYGIQIGPIVVAQVLNYGYIGGVQAQSQNLLLVNFGTIEGVGTTSGLSSTVNVVRNYGIINDYVTLHHGDQLLNFGQVKGNVTLNGGYLKNTGTINGDLQDSSAGGDIVINKGTIFGDVTLSNAINSFDSHLGHVIGTIKGGTAADTINAGSDDDDILGGGGADALKGGAGDDVIAGGAKNDTITGGHGDDTLSGGGDKDTFNFAGNFGHDTISDFAAGSAAGHDVIHFSHDDFADFADVQAHMTQVGADVLISLDATDSIVVQNVTIGNLVSADFLFG